MKTFKSIEILEYFGAEQMINNNTPFEEEDYVNAIDELEELKSRNCNNCKHFDGTQVCKMFIARSDRSSKAFYCSEWASK